MNTNDKVIKRPLYTDWLKRWRDRDVIKILTGLRRCGKSTVLRLFQEQLLAEEIPSAQIVTLNFESLDHRYPTTAQELYDYVVGMLAPGMNYVFLDEVQHVAQFEKAVDGLYVRNDVDIYITGSNADLLSSELATLLTGRYVELRMLPLSFEEYRGTRPSSESQERSFDRYMTYGGLPYAATLDDEQDIADYLGGVFNTILVKDIAGRRPRLDMPAFTRVASFIADNIGNLTSSNSIAKALRERHAGISATTVNEYISALCENYLLFRASRYDIKGKAYLRTLDKFYVGDIGFRFWFLGKAAGDVGHRLENVIYLELLRRYRTVHVGKLDSGEVDFYATDAAGAHYYQVSATVLDQTTLERELTPLRAIDDNHPKTLLTLDRIGNGDHDGIKQVNVIDWLLQ